MPTKSITVAILGKADKSVDTAFGKVTDNISNLGKVGLAAAGIAGVAIGGALAKGTLDALSQSKTTDLFAGQLGLTPAEAERFGSISGELYANAYGDSFEGVGAVLAAAVAVDIPTGQLEAASKTALNMETAFGGAGGEYLTLAGQLREQGLFDTAQQGLDQLITSFQDVGPERIGPLTDAISEYGVQLQGAGFNTEQTFAILANAAKSGEFALDKTGDALKELTLKASDGSAAAGFEAIGLSADDMARRLALGGDDALSATQQIVDGLQGIADPAEQAAAAVAIFGTPLEDVGINQIPEFLAGLDNIPTAMAGVEGAAASLDETLNDNLAVRFETLKRKGFQGLATIAEKTIIPALEKITPLVEDLAEWLGENLPPTIETVQEKFGELSDKLEPLATAFRNGVEDVRSFVTENDLLKPILIGLAAVVAVLAVSLAAMAVSSALAFAPFILIGVAIAGVVAALVWAYENVDIFRAAVDGAVSFIVDNWPKVQEVITTVIDVVVTVIQTAIDLVTKIWGEWGDNLIEIVSTVWDLISGVVDGAIKIITGIIGVFIDLVTGDWDGLWENIKKILDGAWQIITTVIEKGTELFFQIVKLAMEATWKAIRFVWNDLVLPFIKKIPGWIKDGLVNLHTLLVQKGKDVLTGLWNGAKTVWTTVINWVKERPGKIKDGIPNAGDLLKSVGEAIINGLWNGLKSKWSSVKTWLDNRAADVKNAFTSFLGISSPSKVFFGIGQNIMEGLDGGLGSGFKDVEKTLTTQAKAVAALFNETTLDSGKIGSVGTALPGNSGQSATSVRFDRDMQSEFNRNASMSASELSSLRGADYYAALERGKKALTIENVNIQTGQKPLEALIELEGRYGMAGAGSR